MNLKFYFSRVFAILIFTLTFSNSYSQCQISSAGVAQPISCNGVCDGSIFLFSQGGTPPFIVMHPITNQPITYTSATVLTGFCAGTYTLAINNTLGTCPEFIMVTLTQPQPLIATATGNPGAGCTGTATVTASGGTTPYSYMWQTCSGNPIGQSGVTATGLCDGDYQAIVVDANGCTVTSNCVTLTSPCTMNANSQVQNNVTCYGGCNGLIVIQTFGGTPPYVSTINGGQPITYTSFGTFSGLCAGTYTIVTTDNAGCTETEILTVTQPPQLVVSATGSAGSGCTGSLSSNVTGGNPGYSFAWTSCTSSTIISTSQFVSNVCDGQYQVTVTDANGCSETSSCVTLNSSGCNMVGTAFITSGVTCNGACDGVIGFAATNGTPPYTISLNGGTPYTFMSSGSLNNICGGNYTVVFNDAGGCSYTTFVNMTEPTQITVTANTTNESSTGACDGTVTVAATGGVGSYQFSIDGGTTYQGSNNFTSLCSGTYTVCVMDANGCTNCITVTVGSGTPCNMTTIAQVQNNVSCNGECDGLIILQTTGGSPVYTAVVSGGQTIMYTSFGTLGGMCAGAYTILITDNAGCTNTVTATVTQPTSLNIVTTSSNISAPGNCDGVVASNVSGGAGSYVYNWINCTNSNSVGTTGTVTNLCAGSYMLIVTDANGCADSSACITLGLPNSVMDNHINEFKVYPNPATSRITIESSEVGTFTYEILNMIGEIVLSSNSNSNITTIDLDKNDISNGSYLIRIKTGNDIKVVKLIVQK